jgi:hypothetical protein
MSNRPETDFTEKEKTFLAAATKFLSEIVALVSIPWKRYRKAVYFHS